MAMHNYEQGEHVGGRSSGRRQGRISISKRKGGNSLQWDLRDCINWCGSDSGGTHAGEGNWSRDCMISCMSGITL